MWKTMADCHQIQKRTIEEAKLLLFSSAAAAASCPAAAKSPLPAANLAAELRNWRSSFAEWIGFQRCYARTLAGWASRCAPTADGEECAAIPTAALVCTRWSRSMDSVSEERALDWMDFFAAGIASVSAQQRQTTEGLPATEGPPSPAVDVGPKVLCAGLSVAVGSLADFAVASAKGYDAVLRSFEGEDAVM